jgi:Leucine-rich repeat (LRR) protein
VNECREISSSISQLKALSSIDLQNNQLTNLPPQMGFLPVLKKVLTEGNILKTYPRPEKGTKALLDYLKTRMPTEDMTKDLTGEDDEKSEPSYLSMCVIMI